MNILYKSFDPAGMCFLFFIITDTYKQQVSAIMLQACIILFILIHDLEPCSVIKTYKE